MDGRLLANDGKGIEIYDAASGQLVKKIERPLNKTNGTIQRLEFNPGATVLDVTANGGDDVVYDMSSGKLLATLTDTKQAQFSRDGSLLIGGNSRHLTVWRTKDWSKVSDFPNSHGYITAIAAFPEKDLVVVGSSEITRLLRLSSGEELAKLGAGYTHFVALNQTGTLIFTYPSSGFAVWDIKGQEYCAGPNVANGTMALSPDDRWLAAGVVNGGTGVALWKVQNVVSVCGIPAPTSGQ
jgi:WD40 repeat protein